MQLQCPQCATVVEASPGTTVTCPQCQFSAQVPGQTEAPPAQPQLTPAFQPSYQAPPGQQSGPYGQAPPGAQWTPAHQPGQPKPVSQGLAIAALLINILVIPGVGSLIGGRTQEGVAQIVLLVAGIFLLLILVGFFMIIAAWIWGIVTGVQIVQQASP